MANAQVFNFPNFLTLLRILFIPLFIVLFWQGHYRLALLFFLLAGLSDFLDGILARRLNKKTSLGAALDPAADKLLMSVSFIALAIKGVIPVWLAALVVGRDLYIVLGLAVLKICQRPIKMNPTLWSKWNTFFELLFLLGVFLDFAYVQGQPWAGYFALGLKYLAFLIAGTIFITTVQYTKAGFELYSRKVS